jgi:hypothetical protein
VSKYCWFIFHSSSWSCSTSSYFILLVWHWIFSWLCWSSTNVLCLQGSVYYPLRRSSWLILWEYVIHGCSFSSEFCPSRYIIWHYLPLRLIIHHIVVSLSTRSLFRVSRLLPVIAGIASWWPSVNVWNIHNISCYLIKCSSLWICSSNILITNRY